MRLRFNFIILIFIFSFFSYHLHANNKANQHVYTIQDILDLVEMTIEDDSIDIIDSLDTKQNYFSKPDFELHINRDSLKLILNRIGSSYLHIDTISQDSVHIFESMLLSTIQHPYFFDWVYNRKGYHIKNEEDRNVLIQKIKTSNNILVINQANNLYLYELNDKEKIKKNTSLSFQEYVLINQDIMPRSMPLQTHKVAPLYWNRNALTGLHVSQHYVSPNWYRGGESHIAINAFANGFYNYSNKKNIQWENRFDFKAGFNSSSADTVRFLQTNDDLLRLTSKIGYKAFNKFFYTGQAEFSTQLFNTFRPNSYERITAALSPVRFNLSAGLDYKENSNLSIFVSPISYKFIYVNDTTKHQSVNLSIADRLGIKKGRKSLNEVGSLLRVTAKYKITDDIEVSTRSSFYTNYSGIEIDAEIIGDFIINRFLSTRVSLNPRYDSTVKLPNNQKPQLQFRQFISLGFSYRFY